MNDDQVTSPSTRQSANISRSSPKSVLLLAFAGAAFAAWVFIQLA